MRRVCLLLALLLGACTNDPECVAVCDGKACGDDGCGGSCGECGAADQCNAQFQCEPKPTCTDGVRNGLEGDVDCGGDACAPCADEMTCGRGSDCGSGRCEGGRCASCQDGLKSGEEGDVDCGGPCALCAEGRTCRASGDCLTSLCSAGVCASCSNGRKDGAEADVDCAGDCPACEDGSDCGKHADCVSATCVAQVCVQPSCIDQIQNQQESDVDCGGPNCGPCPLGKRCAKHEDCGQEACRSGVCAQAECVSQADNGDVVATFQGVPACVDRYDVSPWLKDASGQPLTIDLTLAMNFDPVWNSTKSVVVRLIHPYAADGTRVRCAELLAATDGKVPSAFDAHPRFNQVYRRMLQLDFSLGYSFNFPLASVGRTSEALLYLEVWYGALGTKYPTGFRATSGCKEGVSLGTMTNPGTLEMRFGK